ncbi:hypothetical protein G6F62_015910 [Rhizopus arrhizus]|nr:hypothetical protein G6F62_015910 [Rhizopus arrhizus]
MLPRATRTASCATAASKNAAITADRKPARAADRSRCAISRDRPAALMRAPRLPPVSIGTLSIVVVVRVAFWVSSTLTSSDG